MDSRDALVNDAANSPSRALARRAEQSLRGLQTFRRTLDDALLSLDLALKTAGETEPDVEISGLGDGLTAAMTDNTQAMVDRVRAEAEQTSAIAERRSAAAEATLAERTKTLSEAAQKLGEAEEKNREMIVTLEDRRRRHEALVTSMADLQAQMDTLQAELDTERERGAGAVNELANVSSAWQQAQTAAQAAEAARRQHEHARKALERELLDVRAALDRARADSTSVSARLEAAGAERASLLAALGDLQRRSAPLDFDRLIATYQELESCTSVAAVLTALTRGLSGEFARVALFGVSGNALQGSYQSGFDINKDITKIVMPLTMESVLTRAFASGRLETAVSEGPLDRVGLPFGGESGWCLSLPVVLKGETVAVVYADHGEGVSGDSELQPSRLAFAELMRRHAIPVLVKLTVDLRAQSELRAYAMLLLDEVEYIYGADVSSGKQNIELVERLTENLRCAQEAYARRLESVTQSDGAPDLFEERLNTLLDTKGSIAFGRHLSVAAAALARVTSSAEPTASQQAAQAS